MFVDSHCHLNLLDVRAHQSSLNTLLEAARSAGIEHFLCPGVTLVDLPEMMAIASMHADISLSVGLHPNETLATGEPTAEDIIQLAQHEKIVAIGETGLDIYRSEGEIDWQKNRFRAHIHAAIATHKPLIIHTRGAKEDTLAILREEKAWQVGGVMHCFTEDWEMGRAALDLGFYISVSGIVTFKNATPLQEIAKKVPSDRLLIETDAPYLAPVPYRGKPNQPAYLCETAKYLAELRQISLEELASQTTKNFFSLFFKKG